LGKSTPSTRKKKSTPKIGKKSHGYVPALHGEKKTKKTRPSGLSDSIIAQRLDLMCRPDFDAKFYRSKAAPKGSAKKRIRSIGVLTSGGDGPAENAAIEAVVRSAIENYGWRVLGIRDGFRGLLDPQERVREMKLKDIDGRSALKKAREILYNDEALPGQNGPGGIHSLGGNILRSSRTNPVQVNGKGKPNIDEVEKTMRDYGIDALVILGGNGSQRAARDLSQMGIPLTFIPQTIDADVPGSITSVGFPSAVERGA